ncbi:carbon starvation CstA family protein [Gimesia maris]|jgi:carbon starvation protein|uniref:carbon starvation CstA family protein n=1 Tax=Gimesia maris TaxID=122 RepID=UPI00118AB222|nr:carbon starvation protein A [Gimesia maris]QDT82117.1 Inner membrane protein YjiY [Gimesia maris]|tara:strand:+ start:40282 stop:42186 length:1905 start_codon:yes stop_codon:yes gene_type:complete
MATLLIAAGAFVGYIIAYHTYGKWLSQKIFNVDGDAEVPSKQLRDDIDFVPTKKEVIFGHHFTSIAGTGPIVGPAIAVFWGWLPALVWVLVGSIFIGAVHDFGALVVSLRNRGQTVGEVAGRLIAPRTRILFLLILLLALTVVLAIFGLVIAIIFSIYPETVIPVWITMPIAIVIGLMVYKQNASLLVPSLVALAIVYASVYLGAYYWPVDLSAIFPDLKLMGPFPNAVILWTFVLLAYCAIASVLPVWLLLQPRDFINSHQLVLALGLLLIGAIVAGATGQADLVGSAPAVAENIPADAPPIWPFLFITIACGACSGFHCLVSSGTSSKQVESELDAQYVGYGAMLLEGGLAVIVILACCAGVGMGDFSRVGTGAAYNYEPTIDAATGTQLTGVAAWETRYNAKDENGWAAFALKDKIGAFILGGANFLGTIGIPMKLGISIIAVLVASFAATTLDTATRLQRYVIQELAATIHIKPLTNKYAATGLAVFLGGMVAMLPKSAAAGPGSGGLILWPLFGATNQLLAGLAFMVIVFYLRRRNKPIIFALVPMIVMLIMPAWAMLWNMFNSKSGWAYSADDWHLFLFGLVVIALQIWMMVEGLLVWSKSKGHLEQQLPELPRTRPAVAAASTGGSN